MSKQYDRDYFDRWYRDPATAVKSDATLARKVAMAVAITEYHLARPLRSVLDVGCGEGAWREPLLALRPGLSYLGLDGSGYAIGRHGAARNLRLCRFEDLDTVELDEPVDLLVCSDVLHYLDTRVLRRGLAEFGRLCDGVAYIDLFARGDRFVGDRDGYVARPARWYRAEFEQHGWTSAGGNCYLSAYLADEATALEAFPL